MKLKISFHQCSIKIKDLIFASTGVIGEEFPVEKIKERLPDLVEKLRNDHNKMYWLKIASAIITTDTKPKVAYEEIIVGDELIRICGIAKGSGMIFPNMATTCLLYTSPSPRDRQKSRMPSSA